MLFVSDEETFGGRSRVCCAFLKHYHSTCSEFKDELSTSENTKKFQLLLYKDSCVSQIQMEIGLFMVIMTNHVNRGKKDPQTNKNKKPLVQSNYHHQHKE